MFSTNTVTKLEYFLYYYFCINIYLNLHQASFKRYQYKNHADLSFPLLYCPLLHGIICPNTCLIILLPVRIVPWPCAPTGPLISQSYCHLSHLLPGPGRQLSHFLPGPIVPLYHGTKCPIVCPIPLSPVLFACPIIWFLVQLPPMSHGISFFS